MIIRYNAQGAGFIDATGWPVFIAVPWAWHLGKGGSTGGGDEGCVSLVFTSGLRAIRLSLVIAGGNWSFWDLSGKEAAIRESVSLRP